MPSDGTASNIQQIGWVMLQTMYTGSRRIHRRSQAGHSVDLTSTPRLVLVWIRIRASMMVIVYVFSVRIRRLRPIFPLPKSNSASEFAHEDWQRPTSIVGLAARVSCRFFTFTEHVSFERSIGSSRPMITSRREGNINKQTKLKQKTKDKSIFAFDRRSVGPLCPTCVWVPQPEHDLAGGAATSLATASNRPHTQPDVADCWPCCHCTRDAWSPWSPARLPFTHMHSPSVFWTTPRKQCNQASPRSRSLQPFQKCKKGLARCHLTTAHCLVCG